MQPRIVQYLVHVDVTYSRNNFLVQEQWLDLGLPRTDLARQIIPFESIFERLRTQGREPLLELPGVQQPRPREARLVPQEEPPLAVEVQHEHQRRLRLFDRRHEQELAPAVELDDEVLGPAPRARDPDAFQPAGELLRGRLLHERGVQHLRVLYLRAGDEPAQVLLY